MPRLIKALGLLTVFFTAFFAVFQLAQALTMQELLQNPGFGNSPGQVLGERVKGKGVRIKNLQGSEKKSSPRVKVDILSSADGKVLNSQTTSADNSGDFSVDIGNNDGSQVNVRVKPRGFLSKIISSQDLVESSSAPVSIDQFAGGDVNDDNVVDGQDFTDMGRQWNQGSSSPADINGDGVVNSLDFMLLKSNFGQRGQ